MGGLQTKLAISEPGDGFEREADRAAEQVMRTPEAQLQSGCVSGEADLWCQKEQIGRRPERWLSRRVQPGDLAQIGAPPVVAEVLAAPGEALDPAARAFLEPCFGRRFARIRVHADSRAAQSASAIGARAYASGNHIVFAAGQYAPGTDQGLRLLAHELVHTVQQSTPSAEPMSLVQRQPASPETVGSIDDRANDPNFLLCLALCELGIPPNLWRTVMSGILSAVSQEYRDRLGDLRGSQAFESFRAELAVMSTFNKLNLVIGFLGESRVGLLTINRPAAQAIRRALLARLAAWGLKSAALQVASQILRKVTIAIEVAVAAGCLAYCGATAMANALLRIRDFASAALDAIAGFINVLSQVGAAIGQAILRPVLVARASMDPANWDLAALPPRSRAHMNAIGLAFRLAFSPDAFVASMARTLNSYPVPQILAELAQDITAALRARGGFAQLVTFTADFIGGLTPLQFVQLLKDYRLLVFVRDPEVLADLQQRQQTMQQP